MNWLANSAFRSASASLFSVALLFAAASCEDPNDLGVELPGTAPISTEYRDYAVNASTVLQKPVQTLNSSRYLVGRVQDAKLGTTTAKSFFNLQTLLAGSIVSPSQYDKQILDSVVIVASFDQVYGSSAQPVAYDVFRLASPLDDQGTYNSTTNVALLEPTVGIGKGLKSSLNRTRVEERPNGLKTKKNVLVDSTTSVTVPDRSVRLTVFRKAAGTLPAVPSAFIEGVFNAIKSKDTPFTQTVLNGLWKGLALAPSDGFSSSVVGFNRAQQNRVIFYYHLDGGTDVNPVPYPISFESSAGAANAPRSFTQISTELTAPFDQLSDSKKSVLPNTTDQAVYMQDGLGLGTKLEIPGLAELVSNKDGLAINRAELIVPVKPYTNALFPLPPQAVVYELGADNTILQRTVNISPFERLIQADGTNQQSAGTNAVATFYDLGPTNKYYSLSMTSYLQAYIYDVLGAERPAALMLFPVVRYSSGTVNLTLNRAVLDAQNIKLRVYFSKLR
ncbi:DUF4270 family protein [Hymenobacter algoricola]|uniref:DUF4270 family protein n=1 Tax=Hymenobacter algoricola TaxID=486267 RepID=A0ABP7N5M2_9BACT